MTLAFAGGNEVEFGERGGQFAGCRAKRSRGGVDFTEHRDRQ